MIALRLFDKRTKEEKDRGPNKGPFLWPPPGSLGHNVDIHEGDFVRKNQTNETCQVKWRSSGKVGVVMVVSNRFEILKVEEVSYMKARNE